ncbi:hypothetical protein EDB89DRAFT_1901418 [Lactarius sanguifluus]|nr:hypothetical protein EDB89DRAFT_1901418 [Lactarius sanguifluus]
MRSNHRSNFGYTLSEDTVVQSNVQEEAMQQTEAGRRSTARQCGGMKQPFTKRSTAPRQCLNGARRRTPQGRETGQDQIYELAGGPANFGTVHSSAARRTGNLASTPAGRHNESKIQVFRQTPHEQAPGIESIHASQSQANRAALGTRARLFPSGSVYFQESKATHAQRPHVTRHRRVGRGEEVDDNGNAAPVCATERDRDVEVGAGQVRQEDTPARCETISPQAVKRKVASKKESKWGHGAPVPPTSHTIDIQKEKQEGSPVTEVGCPVGGAKSNSHGVPVCAKNKTERAAVYGLTKQELRHGGSRWGNLDIERETVSGFKVDRVRILHPVDIGKELAFPFPALCHYESVQGGTED